MEDGVDESGSNWMPLNAISPGEAVNGEVPAFVVGVGASAGGLEALSRFFASVPLGSGLAFVVVQHLSPDHKSYMVDLLARRSKLPVQQAEHGAPLRPDQVYLGPPGKFVHIEQDRIELRDMPTVRSLQMPIDIFFQSIAQNWRTRGVAVVLSGTGSDGTLGVRAIKDRGGMVMVQSEDSAEFDGMPHSAIGTGLADFIGTPEELPELLAQYTQHPLAGHVERVVWTQSGPLSELRLIFDRIRSRHGVDFSVYKPSTIHRRIARRMSVQQIDTLLAYGQMLDRSPEEVDTLFDDLLISVTSFLRDREVWVTLAQEVLPGLLQSLPAGEPVRAWVPGCATGEEPYSLAIVLMEALRELGQIREVKIFATDLARKALEHAGNGIYTVSSVAEVPQPWLERYFIARDGFTYQVGPVLRKSVVFARHNLLLDPPFMRVDLVSCRNLLIYFSQPPQAQAFETFALALKPGGILVLGSSESIGEQSTAWNTVNSRYRIFSRSGAASIALKTRSTSAVASRVASRLSSPLLNPGRLGAAARAGQDTLAHEVLKVLAPASFVVNERLELLHVYGRGGEYLRHNDGAVNHHILQLTAHSVGPALGPALQKAMREKTRVAYDNVNVTLPDGARQLRLGVQPLNLSSPNEGLYLVVIDEVRAIAEPVVALNFQGDLATAQRIGELEQELAYLRENLQSTAEELEAANEELQAANEELIAANEELQSTNEELQSVNEELHSVNAESLRRIDEVQQLSNDLSNMYTMSQVGALLLTEDLRMRRMASAVFDLTGLKKTDLGAPVETMARQLQSQQVVPLLQRVQAENTVHELELQSPTGATLLLRASPALDESGRRDGVVVTLLDVSTRQSARKQLARSEAMLRAVVNGLPQQIAVLNAEGTIVQVNEAWDRFAIENGALPGSAHGVGTNYFQACQSTSGPYAEDALATLQGLRQTLNGERAFFEQVYPCHSPAGPRWFCLHAARLPQPMAGLVISHTLLVSPPEVRALLSGSAT
ncbi:MAG: chemotaxis protein CheB [Hydrogenophaga sp.]